MLTIALVTICILIFEYLFYKRQIKAQNYWPKRGVKRLQSKSLLSLFKTMSQKDNSVVKLLDDIYFDNPEDKILGGYHGSNPVLIVRDPALVKDIMVKDFTHFFRISINSANEPKSLFVLEGEEWKALRQKLTPLFTTGKLKNMMPHFDNAVKDLLNYMSKLDIKHDPVEIHELTSRYTLKSTTSIAFGIDIDTFIDDNNEFVRMTLELLRTRGTFRWIDVMFATLFPSFPSLFSNTQRINKFFLNIVNQVTQEREGKPKTRKDFMDLMIELREQGKILRPRKDGDIEIEITDEIITGHAMVFYTAGFRPSSENMSFLLYELALNPEIQDRCYEEIQTVMKKYDGEITYEAASEMEYLAMAFEEVSRKYPPVALISRQCVEDHYVPELDLTIETGTGILICSNAMQHDPKYFPDPEKFDPERFSPENRRKIPGGCYLPFGDGPRTCIGQRFAKLQSLLGIVHFLNKYKVSPSRKPLRDTAKYHTRGLFKKIQEIWLNIERR